MTRLFIICMAISAAFGLSPAIAASPPKQLHNKTITVGFAVSAQGQGGTLQVLRKIYVSDKGRIFVQGQRTAGNSGDTNYVGPGGYQYSNGAIKGVHQMADFANLLTITFDPAFQTCDATLAVGKVGRTYTSIAPNGKTTQSFTPPSYSKASCAISEGNPFPRAM